MRKNDKRKKRPTRKRPIRMKLTNVKGDPEKQMQLFAEADKHAVLGKYQLAAGICQHAQTGLWQVWMSTAGTDISWLSAHHDPQKAQADVAAYRQFAATPDVYDPEKCAAFFEKLAAGSDAEPENMDAAEIANITATINAHIINLHQPQQEQKQEQPVSLALVELIPGLASVGLRLGNTDELVLIAENLPPQEAAKLVADLSRDWSKIYDTDPSTYRTISFTGMQTATYTYDSNQKESEQNHDRS
jgi:hypothetical protein